ncbi:MAG: AI-2E family transporter [Melioribacteraceae bacterium]
MNEPQNRNLKLFAALTFSAVVMALIAYKYIDILALLAVSILVSMIFNPVVDFLEQRKVPRVLAVLSIFVLTGLLLFTLVSILLPKLINQFEAIANSINNETMMNSIAQFEQTIKTRYPFLSSINFAEKISSIVNDTLLGWISNLSSFVQGVFSFLAAIVIVPFMTFFLLKDSQKLMHGILNLMPNKYFEVSYNVLIKISFQLSRYVRGWILDAAIVGILSGTGLAILGINNAISIGFIAGAGHLIPYFGPIIGGIPAVIISIMQFGNLSMLPSLLLMFGLIYTLDNGFIQPNIFSKSTDMHPVFIILLILVGSQTLGLLGMLLAVPLATVIKTAVKEIYFGYKNYKIISL